MTAEDVRNLIRQECAAAGSARAWAVKIGISGAYVSDVLAGKREPGDSILAPLGLERIVTYQKTKSGKK